jgi:hypothetical protein
MNTTAVNIYIEKLEECKWALNQLSLYVENFGEIGPEDVDYAHVGNMMHLADELNSLVNFIDNTEAS